MPLRSDSAPSNSSLPLIPTGGVNFDNARSYLDAGALTVGIGGELTQPSGLEVLRRWLDLDEA